MSRLALEPLSAAVGTFRLQVDAITFRSGGVTVLLGANGSGKSTLLRVAAGLVRTEGGRALLDGVPLASLAPAARAAAISLVVQRPEVGAPFSVADVVRLGRVARGTDESAVARALARAGVAHLAPRPFHELSGGERQRVAVARALAQHAPGGILLLDEALSAVDAAEASSLLRLFREEAAAGATVLFATHDLALASAVADDVLLLRSGTVHAFGAAEGLLSPTVLEPFLGVPVRRAGPTARGALAIDHAAILSPGTRA
jgi:iron complex transport system ATP-binding protein